MRIALLIRSLEPGGAERQFSLLAAGLARQGHEVTAVAYAGGTAFVDIMLQAGVNFVPVSDSHPRSRALGWILRRLRDERPEVIHSYMPAANLLALGLRRAVGRPKVVWGVRASMAEDPAWPASQRAVWRAHALLAGSADHVIANSSRGLLGLRLKESSSSVVFNGIDVGHFRPSEATRAMGRTALALPDQARLVVGVGRLDPEKHFENFIEMAALVAARCVDVQFVIVGSGDPGYREHLRRLVDAAGLAGRLRLVPHLEGIEQVYSAADVVVSSSRSEGFANVIAEALACGAPVVATDVGEARTVVREPGAVVAPADANALMNAVIENLSRPRDPRLVAARHDWIAKRFSVDAMVRSTERILVRLVSGQVA